MLTELFADVLTGGRTNPYFGQKSNASGGQNERTPCSLGKPPLDDELALDQLLREATAKDLLRGMLRPHQDT